MARWALLLSSWPRAAASRPPKDVFDAHLSPSSLTQPVIDQCVRDVSGALAWGGRAAQGPFVLTYATEIPQPWMLGRTAALHGLPLVVAGLGMPGWNWWEGVVIQKTASPRRAAQLVQSLVGDVPLALVDSGDVLVVNRPSGTQRRGLDRMGRTVLVGGECNSWPICYLPWYEADADGRRCLEARGACMPNGGVTIARSSTLIDFLRAWRVAGEATLASSNAAERGNDQSALHHLYANRSKFPSLTIHVDWASRFSLQLWTCKGGAKGGPLRRPRGGPFEYCHHATHEPLRRVAVSADGTEVAFNESREARGGRAQHPIFIHSNGYHFRLKDPVFAPMLARQDERQLPTQLFDQPVLLVESYLEGKFRPCSVCSLGWLSNQTRYPRGGESPRTVSGGATGSPSLC
ncbi:hypothetical protein AB1Y20_018521 [Prymnesium parvum]|uniref:Uncharacterized protein n=1 Tax=Prymnesium parvum TaxID=97485 RepID=A0AB34JSJ3_PRYPA